MRNERADRAERHLRAPGAETLADTWARHVESAISAKTTASRECSWDSRGSLHELAPGPPGGRGWYIISLYLL